MDEMSYSKLLILLHIAAPNLTHIAAQALEHNLALAEGRDLGIGAEAYEVGDPMRDRVLGTGRQHETRVRGGREAVEQWAQGSDGRGVETHERLVEEQDLGRG